MYSCTLMLELSLLQSTMQGLLEGLYRSRTHPRANDLCSHWRCRSSTFHHVCSLRPEQFGRHNKSPLLNPPLCSVPCQLPSPLRTKSILQPHRLPPSFHLQHLRMLVHTGQQSHAHSSPDRLCDLPLIHSAQAGLPSVFDPAHGRHEFGHH